MCVSGSVKSRAIATTAGLERCFSTLGATYGKFRLKMKSEKAAKLVMLQRNGGLEEEMTDDDVD